MSYANIIELKSCLSDALRYCQEHPDRGHSKIFEPQLSRATAEIEKAVKDSDQVFTKWRYEDRDGRLAWKHLARDLAKTQGRLRKVNALGFIDQKVMYWDQEKLIAAVDEMVDYLRDRTQELDFAAERADKLERQKQLAMVEDRDSSAALVGYSRLSKLRSDAMTNAVDTVANFRRTLRRELGRDDEDYLSIRWPMAVAPDEAVL